MTFVHQQIGQNFSFLGDRDAAQQICVKIVVIYYDVLQHMAMGPRYLIPFVSFIRYNC